MENISFFKMANQFRREGNFDKAISCYKIINFLCPELIFCTKKMIELLKKKSSEKIANKIFVKVSCENKEDMKRKFYNLITIGDYDFKIDILGMDIVATFYSSRMFNTDISDQDALLRLFFKTTKLFDSDFYRDKYNIQNDQLEHFIKYGRFEKKQPSSMYSIFVNNEELAFAKKDPKISVILPVYNCAKFIQKCIDSLLQQTLKDVEFIFVDDGSQDCSLQILTKNMEGDYRIKVLSQQNKFAGVARNHGLQVATGEYICFLDSDDFFAPTLLEDTYKKACETNAEIVIFKAQEYDMQTGLFNPCKFPLSENLFPLKSTFTYKDFGEKIFQANSCIAWNKLFKKSLIDRAGVTFQNLRNSNDTVFVYMLLLYAKTMTFLDKVLVNYRTNNSNSLQRSKGEAWECIYLAFFELKKELCKHKFYKNEKIKKSFVNKALRAIIYYMETSSKDVRLVMECSLQNKYKELLDIVDDYDYYFNKNNYCYLKSIIDKKYIPVVYASDRRYLGITYISICSLLAHSHGNVYIIYILHGEDLTEKDKKYFDRLQSDYCLIKFINMGNYYKNANISIEHTSIATYYRLDIPKLFSCYDKILYLDSDTIVTSDIGKFYGTDLKGYYAAGVKAIAFDNRSHRKRLKIDTAKYINAGVVLYNIKKINEDNLHETFMELLEKKFECQDQDILNVAFNNNTLLVDKRYNFMTKYVKNKENIDINNISIIHFADKIKPWDEHDAPLADYFWDVAQYTPFYTGLFKK